MPGIDMLHIINIDIHSIGTKQAGAGNNFYTNKPAAKREDMKQETNRVEKCYKNTDSFLKSKNKDTSMVNNKLSNTVDYFLPGQNYDSDKKKSAKITEQLQRILKMYLKDLCALMAHFHCS